ncbi:MAG: hypothetical protein ABFC63_03365 [Thermoguttaceae bacterium]
MKRAIALISLMSLAMLPVSAAGMAVVANTENAPQNSINLGEPSFGEPWPSDSPSFSPIAREFSGWNDSSGCANTDRGSHHPGGHGPGCGPAPHDDPPPNQDHDVCLPEPATLAIWSLLGLMLAVRVWQRRRTDACDAPTLACQPIAVPARRWTHEQRAAIRESLERHCRRRS